MASRILSVAFIFFLVLDGSGGCKPQAPKTRLPPASQALVLTNDKTVGDEPNYDPSEKPAFEYYMELHSCPSGEDKKVFALTWLCRNGRSAVVYEVDSAGQEYSARDVYDWAIQNAGSFKIEFGKVDQLQRLVQELPANSVKPPFGQLIIVSGYTGRRWVTHFYNSTQVPEAVDKMLNVLGEHFEITQDRTGQN